MADTSPGFGASITLPLSGLPDGVWLAMTLAPCRCDRDGQHVRIHAFDVPAKPVRIAFHEFRDADPMEF